MKKILAIAAVAALTAGVSAYAANPFADVTPDDWAYQAVSTLSDQGVVEGYPDGTFKGQQNITRYEMAQIVARMMAKEDQYNAEQRATIDKLAAEYADELNNLGVRVTNLENKVGNIKFTGDARMRYQDKGNNTDNWDGRIRIKAAAQVNDNTTVVGRFRADMNFQDGEDANTYMDNLYVQTQGKHVGARIGRYGLTFGNQGGWLYGDAKGFDGAEASYKTGPVSVAVGYGQLNVGKYNGIVTTGDTSEQLDGSNILYAKANADFKVAKVYADYYATKGKSDVSYGGENTIEVVGGGAVVPVGDFRVVGEYYTNTIGEGGSAWNAGIGYGKLNLQKPGSFALDAMYNNVEKNIYFGGTGLQTSVITASQKDDITYWNVLGDVALAKNTYLHGEYAFAADGDKLADPDDSWTVSLNYVF